MRSGGLSTQCAVRQERAEQLVPSGPGAPRLPSLRESRSAGIGQAPPQAAGGLLRDPFTRRWFHGGHFAAPGLHRIAHLRPRFDRRLSI